MPRLLHIDCYGLSGSVTLSRDLEVCGHLANEGQDVTVFMAPAIRRLLDEAGWSPKQLDGLSVNVGPGSYTSLRSTLSLAKGLALAVDRPLMGFPRPELMARTFKGGFENLLVAFHARANRWNRYLYNADYEMVDYVQCEFDELAREVFSSAERPVVMESKSDIAWPDSSIDEKIKYLNISSLDHIELANNVLLNDLFAEYADVSPIYFSDPHITTPKKKLT